MFWSGGTDWCTHIFFAQKRRKHKYGSYGNDGGYDATILPCHV